MFNPFSVSPPASIGYKHLSPHTSDNDTTLADNRLCPRYADSDPTSAPPSPALIETFDVLDNIPWRRSYISLDEGGSRERIHEVFGMRGRANKGHIAAMLLAFTLLVTGCIVGVHVATLRERSATTERCYVRGGGDKCEQPIWAKCISRNGLGYCKGVI